MLCWWKRHHTQDKSPSLYKTNPNEGYIAHKCHGRFQFDSEGSTRFFSESTNPTLQQWMLWPQKPIPTTSPPTAGPAIFPSIASPAQSCKLLHHRLLQTKREWKFLYLHSSWVMPGLVLRRQCPTSTWSILMLLFHSTQLCSWWMGSWRKAWRMQGSWSPSL